MNLFAPRRTAVSPVMLTVLLVSACTVKPQKEIFTVYHLPELAISVSLPAEFMVITRDMVNGAEFLEANDIDIVVLQSGFIKAGVYLNAIPEDFLYEYVISSYRTDESARIGDLTGGEIGAEDIAEQFRLSGLTVSAGAVSEINGRVYYTFDFQRPDEIGIIHSRQFFTIANGSAINIVYNKYGEEFTGEDTEKTEAVLKGIVFERPREGQDQKDQE